MGLQSQLQSIHSRQAKQVLIISEQLDEIYKGSNHKE